MHTQQQSTKKRGGIMRFWDKLKSDAGDAVLTTTVIAMPAFLIVGGFAIDLGKNSYISGIYTSQAQSAAQSAVREIDSRGSLTYESIRVVHNSLQRQRDGDIEEAIWRGGGTCNEFENRDGEVETFPSYTVHLEAENNYVEKPEGEENYEAVKSGTFEFTAGDDFEQKLNEFRIAGGLDPAQVYQVAAVDTRMSSQNILLGMFGQPCQAYDSSVMAGTFQDGGTSLYGDN